MKSKKAQTTNVQIVDGKPVVVEEILKKEVKSKEETKKSKIWIWVIILLILLGVGFLTYYFFL